MLGFHGLSNNKKNVLILSSGTIIGQLISIFFLPLITRFYGIQSIGIWSFVNSIALVITSFSDLGLNSLIMTIIKEKIIETFQIISTISLFFSFIFGIIFAFLFEYLYNDFNFIFLLFSIPLLFFSYQQIQINYMFLNRNKDYKSLFFNPILQNISFGLLALILNTINNHSSSLLSAFLLSNLIAIFNMRRKAPHNLLIFKLKKIKDVLEKHSDFIIYQSSGNFISSIQSQIPTFLIKILWGDVIVGLYSITVKILKLPITFVSRSIGKVFFQIISDMSQKNRELGPFVYRNLIKNLLLAIIPLTLLIAFGDHLIVLFLGENWIESGTYIRLLSIQYYFLFVTGSIQGLSIVLKKQKYAFIVNLFQTFSYAISLIIGKIYFDNILFSLVLLSSFTVFSQAIYISTLLKLLKQNYKIYLTILFVSLFLVLFLGYSFRGIYFLFRI